MPPRHDNVAGWAMSRSTGGKARVSQTDLDRGEAVKKMREYVWGSMRMPLAVPGRAIGWELGGSRAALPCSLVAVSRPLNSLISGLASGCYRLELPFIPGRSKIGPDNVC